MDSGSIFFFNTESKVADNVLKWGSPTYKLYPHPGTG